MDTQLTSACKKIAIATETIELAETSTTEVEGLSSIISDTDPRYSFFRFSYNQEGFEQAPIIFIYTCPAGSKIKERMVYATSRAGVVLMAIHEAGLEVVKKVGNPRSMGFEANGCHYSSKRRIQWR